MRQGKDKIFDSKRPEESEMFRIIMILLIMAFIIFLAVNSIWNPKLKFALGVMGLGNG